MSELDKLLEGVEVEWKTLGEVGEFVRGRRFVKTDIVPEGIPCIHYGEMYTHYGIWADKSKSFVSAELASKLRTATKGDVVFVAAGETIEDIGKATGWLGDEDVVIHDACFFYKSSLNPKYVAYFSRTKFFHDQIKNSISSGKISAINAKGFEKVIIPIPSLEIQTEIVRILDAFSETTEQLIAELTAELTARKKQYEHYRDKLLNFSELPPPAQVKWLTISEICKKIISGGTPLTNNRKYYDGNIPWLRTQEVNWVDIYDTGVKITEEGLNNSSTKWIPANCVIIAMYGATAAKVGINKIPLTTNQACCNLEIDEMQANYKYVFHWLCKEYEGLKALGEGAQSNINGQKVKNYKILRTSDKTHL